MKVNINSKLYDMDGEVFSHEVAGKKKDTDLFFWIRTACNNPKDQKFVTEESAVKCRILTNIIQAEDKTVVELDADEVTMILDTLRPITPSESFLQIKALLNGKENPFQPAKDDPKTI